MSLSQTLSQKGDVLPQSKDPATFLLPVDVQNISA